MDVKRKNSGPKKKRTETVLPQRKPDLIVPYELGEKILQYLGTKPYAEVHQFIAGLMRCAQAAQLKETKDA